MKEVVILECGKTLEDVTTFLKRSGRYIESGYELGAFKTDDGLEAMFMLKPPKPHNPIGFKIEEEKTDDNGLGSSEGV